MPGVFFPAGGMMYAFLALDDRGAAATDWVALSAGIIVLGLVVMYMVMGNSHVYLAETFEELNQEFENEAGTMAAVERSLDLRPMPANNGKEAANGNGPRP